MSAEQAAVTQNQQVVQEQSNALAQENGQIATLSSSRPRSKPRRPLRPRAAKLAAAQAAAAAPSSGGGGGGGGPAVNSAAANPPPVAAGGSGAVAAAESQIGVPYVWGGETPGVGFDCSGLTAWSWGQAGVSLPHFSGAQMADSTPVPLSDLQPGDLLFYGPGGGDHVAMYVSPGTMIEAPQTGSFVHLTGLRLDSGFVGAGRP